MGGGGFGNTAFVHLLLIPCSGVRMSKLFTLCWSFLASCAARRGGPFWLYCPWSRGKELPPEILQTGQLTGVGKGSKGPGAPARRYCYCTGGLPGRGLPQALPFCPVSPFALGLSNSACRAARSWACGISGAPCSAPALPQPSGARRGNEGGGEAGVILRIHQCKWHVPWTVSGPRNHIAPHGA